MRNSAIPVDQFTGVLVHIQKLLSEAQPFFSSSNLSACHRTRMARHTMKTELVIQQDQMTEMLGVCAYLYSLLVDIEVFES
jgi:hypothetical protein